MTDEEIRAMVAKWAAPERDAARRYIRQIADEARAELGLPSRTQEAWQQIRERAAQISSTLERLAAAVRRL